MKKSILLTIFSLLFINLIAVNKEPPLRDLHVDGAFIGKKGVKTEIYLIMDDNSCEKISEKHNFRYFNIDLEVGFKYFLRFVSSDGTEKHLLVSADKSGNFSFNVDFEKDQSGYLKYDFSKKEYLLTGAPKNLMRYGADKALYLASIK